MFLLEQKIEKYNQQKTEIETLLGENRSTDAKELIALFSKEYQNSTAYGYEAICFFQEGEYENAIEILDEGIKKYPFSFSLHYNKAFIFTASRCYEQAIENYFDAVKYSLTEEEKQFAIKGVEETAKNAIEEGKLASDLQVLIKNQENKLQQFDARVYPIDIDGVSMIRKPQKTGTPDEYMINMYDELTYADVDIRSRMLFKSELVKGEVLKSKKVFQTVGAVVIPISKIEQNAAITIRLNGERFKFQKEHLPMNQFHYIRITDPGKIEIVSDAPIFVGNPIELEPEKKPIKLVMKIFIDGLSYQYLQEVGLKEVMPNTYSFFKDGFIAENCFAVSEWTLPSKSSINTGLYATTHKMLHPEYYYNYLPEHQLMAEYFKEAGYYCTNISSNWRTTPALGYYRGFDRMIYQNFLGGMDAKNVLFETLEHLMSLPGQNHFISISMTDPHNVPDQIEKHLYSQVQTDIKNRIYKNNKGITSVQTSFDESKIEKYRQEIMRVDALMSVLYDYILKEFKEEEISITFHSDHGQSFLSKDFDLLNDKRMKIPFMMRGKNIPSAKGEEMIESVDILPSILNSCGLQVPRNIDGRLPYVLGGDKARKNTVSEILHPNQTYKIKIREENISYFFETKEAVNKDLTFTLEGYTSWIIDNETKRNVTDVFLDKKQEYDIYVFDKVKNFLK